MTEVWRYPRARILRWIDGDTVDVSVDLGFYTTRTERVRLLGSKGGVNAPESDSADPKTRALAMQAWAKAIELAPPLSTVSLETAKDRRDGFRRFLVRIILADGRDLGDVLLGEGLAAVWK